MPEQIISPKLARLMPADVLAKVQQLLVVAYTIADMDVEDERELGDAIAELIDDAVTYRNVPAPYGVLLEVADRSVLRIMARQAVRHFRKRWGKLSQAERDDLLNTLLQAEGDM